MSTVSERLKSRKRSQYRARKAHRLVVQQRFHSYVPDIDLPEVVERVTGFVPRTQIALPNDVYRALEQHVPAINRVSLESLANAGLRNLCIRVHGNLYCVYPMERQQ